MLAQYLTNFHSKQTPYLCSIYTPGCQADDHGRPVTVHIMENWKNKLLRGDFFRKHKLRSPILKRRSLLRFIFMNGKSITISQAQYHGRWWLGTLYHRDIRRTGIDLVFPEYLYPCTARVKPEGIMFMQKLYGQKVIYCLTNIDPWGTKLRKLSRKINRNIIMRLTLYVRPTQRKCGLKKKKNS